MMALEGNIAASGVGERFALRQKRHSTIARIRTVARPPNES